MHGVVRCDGTSKCWLVTQVEHRTKGPGRAGPGNSHTKAGVGVGRVGRACRSLDKASGLGELGERLAPSDGRLSGRRYEVPDLRYRLGYGRGGGVPRVAAGGRRTPRACT